MRGRRPVRAPATVDGDAVGCRSVGRADRGRRPSDTSRAFGVGVLLSAARVASLPLAGIGSSCGSDWPNAAYPFRVTPRRRGAPDEASLVAQAHLPEQVD